jgi:hypothetical protein
MMKGAMAIQRDPVVMDPVAKDQVLMPVWVATKRDLALICSCSATAVFAGVGEVAMTHSVSRVNWVAEGDYSTVDLALLAVLM